MQVTKLTYNTICYTIKAVWRIIYLFIYLFMDPTFISRKLRCDRRSATEGSLLRFLLLFLDTRQAHLMASKVPANTPWCTNLDCCFLESLVVSGLTTNTLIQATQPRMIRQAVLKLLRDTPCDFLHSITGYTAYVVMRRHQRAPHQRA